MNLARSNPELENRELVLRVSDQTTLDGSMICPRRFRSRTGLGRSLVFLASSTASVRSSKHDCGATPGTLRRLPSTVFSRPPQLPGILNGPVRILSVGFDESVVMCFGDFFQRVAELLLNFR